MRLPTRPHSSVGRASHWYCGGHGSNPVEASELRTALNSCFISARIIFTSNLDTFN